MDGNCRAAGTLAKSQSVTVPGFGLQEQNRCYLDSKAQILTHKRKGGRISFSVTESFAVFLLTHSLASYGVNCSESEVHFLVSAL